MQAEGHLRDRHLKPSLYPYRISCCSVSALIITGSRTAPTFHSGIVSQTGFFVSVHPNAGLPDQFGEYDQSAEFMASVIEDFMKEGWINIAGGCCGTTPLHIRRIAGSIEKISAQTEAGYCKIYKA